MNKKVMKKWVKALRSGEYKQGQGLLKQTTLENKTYHCCLGVLCELYNEDRKEKKKKTLKEARYNGVHRFDNQAETLPKNVQKWSGLKGNQGNFGDDNELFSTLADMNDLGCSFKKIAKTIEKNWENL